MGERQEAEDRGWECCRGAVKRDEGQTKAALILSHHSVTAFPGETGGVGQPMGISL